MEIRFELPDGTVLVLERQRAKQVAEKLWELGLELPGAITVAARIDEEVESRSRFAGYVAVGTREATALRAAVGAVEADTALNAVGDRLGDDSAAEPDPDRLSTRSRPELR